MLFKSVLATSALAATALAAPNAQWGHPRPSRYTRPVSSSASVSSADDCAVPTATTTAYVTVTEHDEATTSSTTSSAVVVDPTGGDSTSDVTADPTGPSTSDVVVDPTSPSTTDIIVDPTGDCTATTAVETLTETATYTATITEVATVTVPYPGGNVTVPGPTGTGVPEPPKDCITEEEADQLGDVFRLLIQEYSDELALAALTEDFVDYSSAVNIIMNKGAQYPKNITGPTFATRQQFMDGQGSQPLIPFERIFTVHGCDTVSVRWWSSRSASGQKTEVAAIPVVGNGILKAVRSEEAVQTHQGITYNWRVKELYSEFNAAAWLVNLGVFTPAGPVDWLNTNTTTKRSIDSLEHFDQTLRGPMI